MILCIRSDSDEVEVYLYQNDEEKICKTWNAGRNLSEQLLKEINNICNSVAKSLAELTGVVVYQGPGSYTGLRISVSLANSLGYSYKIPVVGVSGDNWLSKGLSKMQDITKFSPITPIYGGEVYTTKPKK